MPFVVSLDRLRTKAESNQLDLNYDIVIATRNRQDVLRLSIPLMLAQSCVPEQIIIVDSSEDHKKTIDAVEDALSKGAADSKRPPSLKIVHTKPGLTMQRMVGLNHVTSTIVFYPDDDALWHPGTAQSIMHVYERDVEKCIGGVCAGETSQVPPGVESQLQSAYQMTGRDRLQQRIGNVRTRFEKRWIHDPFVVFGQSRWGVKSCPEWLEEENAVQVEWMTGFRMTFRTDMIRKTGFDTDFPGYAVFEDVDACWGVSKTHLLVGARSARVYHYRAPFGRADGLGMGVRQILDKAYVLCKHSEAGAAARQKFRPWCVYKMGLYLGGLQSHYGRQRFIGAWRAWRRISRLLDASGADLREVYLRCRAECLGDDSGSGPTGREQ